MESDFVDDTDDLANLVSRFGDFAHRLNGTADDQAAFLRFLGRLGDNLAGFGRAIGRATDGVGDFIERGGGLFQTGGLLLGTARQVVRGAADLVCAGGHAAGRVDDRLNGLTQTLDRAVKVGPQSLIFRREGLIETDGQIAIGQAFQSARDGFDHVLLFAFSGEAALFVLAALFLEHAALFSRFGFTGPVGNSLLEGVERTGQEPDLVGARRRRNRHREVALCQAIHDPCDLGDGLNQNPARHDDQQDARR